MEGGGDDFFTPVTTQSRMKLNNNFEEVTPIYDLQGRECYRRSSDIMDYT